MPANDVATVGNTLLLPAPDEDFVDKLWEEVPLSSNMRITTVCSQKRPNPKEMLLSMPLTIPAG